MQAFYEARLEYGYHPVFVLAALLDPALYVYVHTIDMEERIKAEELLITFFGLAELSRMQHLGS